jgi:hypothetical protein
MINQKQIQPIIICFVLMALSFFIGKHIGSNEKSSKINAMTLKIATDSLKFEIQKQKYENDAKEIHYKMSIRQTKIDTSGVAYIDSLWGSYGL